MKLSSVTIKNYRALEDITINFNQHMNVIYGVNGVGKSSILYALHDFLNLLISKNGIPSNYPLFSKWRIRDINKNAEFHLKFIDGSEASAILNPKEIKSINNSILYDWRSHGNIPDGTKILFNNTDIHFSSFLPNINTGLKIEAVQVGDKIDFRITDQPKVAYIRGVNYQNFKMKFEELENLENQKRIRDQEYRDQNLDKIRNTIPIIAENLSGLTIDREQQGNPLCVMKYGKYINIEDQLSSGEASIVVLIAQIALNIAEGSEGNIVLIDEVDTSLHPQWQMKVCRVLRKAFPDVQFILTSHSPFVWAGLNKDEIIWLDRDENRKVIKKDVEYAKGGGIANIIADYFELDDIPDEEVSNDIYIIEDLINARNIEKAEEMINKLIDKYGYIPAVERLRFRIRMMGL